MLRRQLLLQSWKGDSGFTKGTMTTGRLVMLAVVAAGVMLGTFGWAPARVHATPTGAWGEATLCSDIHFGGACQTFYFDVSDLRGTSIGNDRTSSLNLGPRMVIALYENINYQGMTPCHRSTSVTTNGFQGVGAASRSPLTPALS
jgi:hypothetical protein